MTTTVVHSIGAGKDYSTVAAWWAAAPANLVTSDEIWKGEVYDELSVSSMTTLGGITTDSTRYAWLTAAATCSFADDPTSALRYTTGKAGMAGAVTTYGSAKILLVTQSYTRVDRLQFAQTANAGSVALHANAGGMRVIGNLIEHSAISAALLCESNSGVQTTVANNVVIVKSPSGGIGMRAQSNDNPNMIANTIVCIGGGGDWGITAGSGYVVPLCIDNAIFGFTGSMSGTSGFGGSDYNCTDVASLAGSGTHQLTSKTFASQFRDNTSGSLDLRVAVTGSDLAGAGNRQATYTSDLDVYGVARSVTTPTIGAVELAGATVAAKRLLMLGAG